MVFSSVSFLFFFMPIFFILYYIVPSKFKNFCLLIFSLIFYAWGEPIYILLMLFETFINYICANIVFKHNKKIFLIITIILNILVIGFFKYSDFLIDIINNIFNLNIENLNIGLPIGISFFTFQGMSYVIDVYRKEVKPEKNYFTLLTYISMFPQLIAGPIVRYETVRNELNDRKITFDNFSSGMVRFLKGLYKKVLLANIIGSLFEIISNDISSISLLTAWLGSLAFTLQIYFDFSGYSDMAIGLGKMLGFNFLENFNYPYIAVSITDFWRRWHISLSTWFKDYVYIPLGGSKKGVKRTIINLLIVWLLTGIWHGADYNFIIWGLYYGILLIIEKFILKNIIDKFPKVLKHIYTMFFVLIGWIIFSITDINNLILYLSKMFDFTNILDNNFIYYISNYGIIILFGVILSLKINIKENKVLNIIKPFIFIVLFIITVSFIVSDSYNPFLYFRF